MKFRYSVTKKAKVVPHELPKRAQLYKLRKNVVHLAIAALYQGMTFSHAAQPPKQTRL